LEAAGITSLKIEGRLRRPEYVAAAVDACRRALAGEKADIKTLERVFSRSGFTDGYLRGTRDLSMFGRRTEADKSDSAAVLSRLSGLYRRELSRVPVDMALTVHPDKPVALSVSDGRREVTVHGDKPEPVHSMEPDFSKQLGRTGGTPFCLRDLKIDSPGGWTAKLNPLRREALEKLLKERETTEAHPVVGFFQAEQREKSETQPRLRLRFETTDQLFDHPLAEAIYLPVERIDDSIINRFGNKLIAELPRLLFPGREAALKERLAVLQKKGLRTVCAGNPGTVEVAKDMGFRVSGGFDLNILNSKALAEWASLGVTETLLSPEIRIPSVAVLGGEIPKGIISYGHLPLMMYRCCPMQGLKGCGNCSGREQLADRQGERFTVLCHERRYSSLLNPVPLYVSDRSLQGLDFQMAYFTLESRERCRTVTEMIAACSGYDGKRTLGPYFRSMQ